MRKARCTRKLEGQAAMLHELAVEGREFLERKKKAQEAQGAA
jgi:hypothetical protein